MQTYKNYQHCTTITADKIKIFIAACTYFVSICKDFTHPESKLKHHIAIILIILQLNISTQTCLFESF